MPNPESNKIKNLIPLIFFLSGIAGLSYQILWVKLFSQIFGHTIYAVSTVVAAFMGGLALGSYVFGKMVDRHKSPMRLYALLETGIGIYALILVFAFPLLNSLYVSFFKMFDLAFTSFSVTRLVFSLVILIIPTSLIGGTFPVIARFYIDKVNAVQKGSGVLYAVNTVGAVCGSLLMGFFLLEWLGISLATTVIVGLNLILAMMAVLIARPVPTAKPKKKVKTGKDHRFILFLYAVSGFVALSLEVLWSRELSIVFLSSTYSFTTVLVTFLVGLSAGSYWLSRAKKLGSNPLELFYILQYALAVFALLSIPLLRYLPQELYIEAVAARTITWAAEIGFNFLIAFMILIIPTFIMGAAFPLVCRIYTSSAEKIGTEIGAVFAYNTLGAISGSLIAGFILIPVFGVLQSIAITAFIALLIALAVVVKYTRFTDKLIRNAVFATVFILLFLTITTARSGFRPLPEGTRVLFAKEDVGAEIKVLEDPDGNRALYLNEKQQGGTQVQQTERWAGQVPLIFHSNPDSVLLIGLGTGVTLNALTEGSVKHVDCVDLIGSLEETTPYFADINGDVLRNRDNVRLISADGINFLNLIDHAYDIILCDIVHPDDAGAGGLYSLDFYQSCRNGLKKGGFFAQWVILDQLSLEDLKTIIATFVEAFPDAQFYLGQERTRFQKLLLLGPKSELGISPKEIEQRLLKASFSSEFQGRQDPVSFLSSFVSCAEKILPFLKGLPINTLDRPVIEYRSPRHKWQAGKSVFNLQFLSQIRKPIHHCIPLDSSYIDMINAYFSARSYILQGRMFEFSGNLQDADIAYSQAALTDVDTVLVSRHLLNLSHRLVNEKMLENALMVVRKSLATNHANSAASHALADLLLFQKNETEALEYYKYTVQIDPEDFIAFRKIGDLSARKQDFDSALYAYRMSLSLSHDQPVVHFIVGQLFMNFRKDYELARTSFETSLELNPAHKYATETRTALHQLNLILDRP